MNNLKTIENKTPVQYNSYREDIFTAVIHMAAVNLKEESQNERDYGR